MPVEILVKSDVYVTDQFGAFIRSALQVHILHLLYIPGEENYNTVKCDYSEHRLPSLLKMLVKFTHVKNKNCCLSPA